MRTKSLLPVQVAMPTNWMGGNQSSHKAAFEQALHNSIENSLRSSSAPPSAVFSSLFLTLKTSASSTLAVQCDIKPSIELFEVDSSRPNANHIGQTDQNNPGSSLSYLHQSRTLPITGTETRGPPSLLAVTASEDQQRAQIGERQTIHNDNRQAVNAAHPPQMTMLAHQQQLEQFHQARLEQLKQLQKLQAWQQMQKGQQQQQSAGSRIMMPLPGSRDQLTQQASVAGASLHASVVNLPRTASNIVSPRLNGIQQNGSMLPMRPAINIRHEMPHISNMKGFCKAGKDIRLCRFEHDCSKMYPYPPEYVLLALQPALAKREEMILVAVNLKSLPPPTSTSQVLSAHCVGCGENGFHNFSQFSSHIGLESNPEVSSTPLNSSQLLGTYARFYLVRDAANPIKLIRSSPTTPYAANEGRTQPQAPVQNPITAFNSSHVRSNMVMVSPSHHGGAVVAPENPPPLQNLTAPAPYQAKPHLKRALSSPLNRSAPDPGKRQTTSYSQDEPIVIREEPTPKRYQSESSVGRQTVEIPDDLLSKRCRKPAVLFLNPLSDLPQFSGDLSSIIITSQFSQCFKPPSDKVREGLNIPDHCTSMYNKLMLLALVQYCCKLGPNQDFTLSGLSLSVAATFRSVSSWFTELKPSGVLSLLRLISSSSKVVDVIHCKESIAQGLTQCLQDYDSSLNVYQVLIYFNDNACQDISFHLLACGSVSRSIEEVLQSRDDRSSLISQGLVSLHYSQLHLSLSDVAKVCYYNVSTSNPIVSKTETNVAIQHSCLARRLDVLTLAAGLLATVERVLADLNGVGFTEYSSLRFLFLVPPNSCVLSEAVQSISQSGILSDLSKIPLSKSYIPSQVVATLETSSLQRISSLCKQCENTSTLLFLIHLDAHLSDRNEAIDYLNSPDILKSNNIITIQSSPYPYPLLTEASRIPLNNIVSLKGNKENRQSHHFGPTSNCYAPQSSIFDPNFELQRKRLCERFETLHSSLILCEFLIHQYVTSLLMTSSSNGTWDHRSVTHDLDITSPIMNQVVRDLIRLDSSGGCIIIVRTATPILATRFFDGVKQTRDKLGLIESFEVLLYDASDVNSLSVSEYFVEKLRILRKESQNWKPKCLCDLHGISCLLVYTGEEVITQQLPRSLRYVDLRLAFEGQLTRSKVEQELSLAAPLCVPKLNGERQEQRNNDVEHRNGIDSSHNAQHTHDPTISYKRNKMTEYGWTVEEKVAKNGFRNEEEEKSYSESKQDEVILDFIGLAMKEADLPADENLKNLRSQHTTPRAILPEKIYNMVNEKTELSRLHLLPHSSCKWDEALHPAMKKNLNAEEEAQYYRQWTTPVEGHPDFENMDRTVDGKRILLATPPNSSSSVICCQFLRLVNNKLVEAMNVTVYDDPEEDCEEFENSFHAVISNNVERDISQLTNSCIDVEDLDRFTFTGQTTLQRSVTTRQCKYALTNRKYKKCNVTNGEVTAVEKIIELTANDACFKNTDFQFRIIIPSLQTDKFRFSGSDETSSNAVSLKLKHKNNIGIKSPIVSFGIHGVKQGLYNIGSGSESITHVLVVRDCDSEEYKSNFHDHVIVILPPRFDFLGTGAMKYGVQLLFDHFYNVEQGYVTDCDVIWPFALFLDDDVVAFSKLNDDQENDMDDQSSWLDLPLGEVMEAFEAFAQSSFAAVGFKPWSSDLPSSLSSDNMFGENSFLSSSILESCFFINIHSTNAVKYSYTKFYNEDIDWSLRAADSGLQLLRFENVAMVTKKMLPIKTELELKNTCTPLVTTADSEFKPLYFHPALLLEKYLPQFGPLIFSSARGPPIRPVLCVDCYQSLGNQICVQFVSSAEASRGLGYDQDKEYGGLILSSTGADTRPGFLDDFTFVNGAVVCVIGTDRNSLRQTIVNLRLEAKWHFRLTDEFQTANNPVLGGIHVKPFYFLTGAKKDQ